jgi:hypothetical protein
MEAYLEAIDVGCLRAITEGLPNVKDPANPVGDEEKYDRWNAKAKNALYHVKALCLVLVISDTA